jgi:hypothetical protein
MATHVRLCRLQRGSTRLEAASDKAFQLLAYGRGFSPGTPTSHTTKTGRHDLAEIESDKKNALLGPLLIYY